MFTVKSIPQQPAKVSGSPVDWPDTGVVKAIMKVKRPGHVPKGVSLRSRIDDTLFTCEFDIGALHQIAADPLVESISAAQPVQAAGPTSQAHKG